MCRDGPGLFGFSSFIGMLGKVPCNAEIGESHGERQRDNAGQLKQLELSKNGKHEGNESESVCIAEVPAYRTA